MHTTIRSRIEKCRLLPRFPSLARRGSRHGPSGHTHTSPVFHSANAARACARAPINATFADYVATVPLWERDLLAHATEEHCPDSSLYEVLQQTNVNILVASDGGHRMTTALYCEGVARDYPVQSYRAEGYGRMSVLLLLTHYIRYYNIKPADDKRDFADLTRPAQLNVLADHRATAALDELRAARKTPEFYPLPACRGYLCDASGHITSREIRTLRTELPEYELRAYLEKCNERSDDVYDSISWRAYGLASAGLTDSLRTFMVKLSHS
jgi:hypothetical protein